jgi:hypothetical protein
MTAVEFLVETIDKKYINAFITRIVEQAKKMEKKQIMEALLTSKPTTFYGWKNEFEKYYNEKLKK